MSPGSWCDTGVGLTRGPRRTSPVRQHSAPAPRGRSARRAGVHRASTAQACLSHHNDCVGRIAVPDRASASPMPGRGRPDFRKSVRTGLREADVRPSYWEQGATPISRLRTSRVPFWAVPVRAVSPPVSRDSHSTIDFVAGRGELTDAAWERIEPLLPQADGRGRPWRDPPQLVNGVLWW